MDGYEFLVGPLLSNWLLDGRVVGGPTACLTELDSKAFVRSRFTSAGRFRCVASKQQD